MKYCYYAIFIDHIYSLYSTFKCICQEHLCTSFYLLFLCNFCLDPCVHCRRMLPSDCSNMSLCLCNGSLILYFCRRYVYVGLFIVTRWFYYFQCFFWTESLLIILLCFSQNECHFSFYRCVTIMSKSTILILNLDFSVRISQLSQLSFDKLYCFWKHSRLEINGGITTVILQKSDRENCQKRWLDGDFRICQFIVSL